MSVRPKTVGRYRRLDKIGYGNFGVVYKGVDTSTNRVVAIKTLDLDAVNDEVESVQHEVGLLAHLSQTKSANVTKYYGTVLEGSKLWIVMDLCSGGSVRTLLRAGTFEDKHLGVLFREIAVAVNAIHSEGIIHRDLKAANVLITLSGQVKLCDFGVAAVAPSHQPSKRSTIVGTPYWMAPEVIAEGQSYTNKADIWSLGITFYETVTGNPPYSEHEAMRALMLITNSRPPRLEGPKYSPALKDLVALCLDEVPDARPSADEILKHRFLKQFSKTPTSILRGVVDRYVQWKNLHRDHRDSLLMFNPHIDEDEIAEAASDTDSLWDFDTANSSVESVVMTTVNAEKNSIALAGADPVNRTITSQIKEEDMSDAPDSLRELFGVPPRAHSYSTMSGSNQMPPRQAAHSNSVTSTGTITGSGTITPSVTPGGTPAGFNVLTPGHSNYAPSASAHAPSMPAMPNFDGTSDESHQRAEKELAPEISRQASFKSPQPSVHSHIQTQLSPQMKNVGVNVSHIAPGSSLSSINPTNTHSSQAQPQSQMQSQTLTHSHTQAAQAGGFMFPPSKPNAETTPGPTATSTRGRSTTFSASPSISAGSWKGWRGRHGSEIHLDQMKRQISVTNTPVMGNSQPVANSQGLGLRADSTPGNIVPHFAPNGNVPISNASVTGLLNQVNLSHPTLANEFVAESAVPSPRTGMSRHNSVSDRHPSASYQATQAAQAAQQAAVSQALAIAGGTAPVHYTPAHSPSQSPVIEKPAHEKLGPHPPPLHLDGQAVLPPPQSLGNVPQSYSPAPHSAHFQHDSVAKRPTRAALPRLQMPPRPVPKQSQSGLQRQKRPVVWPSEFPPMPQLDLNSLLDSTPDHLVVATLLELTTGFKMAISSLAGQLE